MTNVLTAAVFQEVVTRLGTIAVDDIAWANECCPPWTPEVFALEVAFVICNSGMHHRAAWKIYDKVQANLQAGKRAAAAFGHKAKAAAIDRIWKDRRLLHRSYMMLPTDRDRLDYLAGLPWIGPVTCYHVAKNFGVEVAKPDVHLVRLAGREGVTVQALCERLSRETGLKVAAVDTVLWRACATGVINSKTGALR